jgi:hypothetical protein
MSNSDEEVCGMNKKWMLGMGAVLMIGVVVTGCGSKEKVQDMSAMNQASSTQMAVDPKGSTSSTSTSNGSQGSASQPAPTLEAELKPDGRSATITFKVTNFKLSAEHIGQKPVPGEGHLHLYVDGKEKAMLKTDAPVRLENLSVGKHNIKLSLRQNDHTALKVEKEFNIEVK